MLFFFNGQILKNFYSGNHLLKPLTWSIINLILTSLIKLVNIVLYKARVDQVKQFKEQQENIQKHLDEELAKEREKNRILESQLDKSKEFVGEWKENIIKQLDAIKKNIEEVSFKISQWIYRNCSLRHLL